MKSLTFIETLIVTEDDFITMEMYLNEYLREGLDRSDSGNALNSAFLEMTEDFLFESDIKGALWECHKDEILEEFKKWHKNS
jgi:hypothetical protein